MSEVNGDHKRKREASMEEETLDAGNDADNEQEEEQEEEEEEEMLICPNYRDYLPKDMSIIDELFIHDFIDILSSKVENDFELKLIAQELFQSLNNATEDSEQVPSIVSGVKKLFESAVFIQACVEAHMEDQVLLAELEPNFTSEGKERMEALKRDKFFQPILQETQSTAIIRGVLAVVFGYWSDKDCYHKVSEAIHGELKKIPKPDPGPPLEMVYDDIPNIDISPDIEGLKEALTARYRNDPNHDYNHVCEEIERNKLYFEQRAVGPFSPDVIPKRIKRLGVLWMNKSLTLRVIEFCY